MPRFNVTLPIAGHLTIEVEAEDEEKAVIAALEGKVEYDAEPTWEVMERFMQGNVCYCPTPWQAEAELIEEDAKETQGGGQDQTEDR